MESVYPQEPQIVGALGATLIADAELRKTEDQTLNL